jgi:hypothetical protein
MVKTAAQLKDHYTNSHTDCMIEYEVEKIMAHRNKKGNPMEYHIKSFKWLGYEDPRFYPADDSWGPEGGLTRDGTVDNICTLTNTNKKTTCYNRNTTPNKNQHDMFESSHSNLDDLVRARYLHCKPPPR